MRGTAAYGGAGNEESMERGLAGARLDLRADKEIGSARWTRHPKATSRSSVGVAPSQAGCCRARGVFGHRRRGRASVQARRPTKRASPARPNYESGSKGQKGTREEQGQSAARGRGVPRACGVGRSWQRAIGRVEDLCSPDRRAVLEGRRVHGCAEWEPGVRAAEGGGRTAVVVSNQASRSS